MEINGYPIRVPMHIPNGHYGLKFSTDYYELIPLDEFIKEVCIDIIEKKAIELSKENTTNVTDEYLYTLLEKKLEDDKEFLKRANMKLVVAKKKKQE